MLLLSLSTTAAAQLAALKSTTPRQRATVQTDLMRERLGLTGNTLQQVSAINLEYATKVQPILEGADRPLEQLREIKQINEQKEAALKQVLSADQFQQYQAAKEEMRQQFEQRLTQGANTPAAPPQ